MIQAVSIFLILFAVLVALAWCWGYLIGAGLTYLGVIQDPTLVAWAFMLISAVSILLQALAARKKW